MTSSQLNPRLSQLLFALLILASLAAAQTPATRVLFIGNSYTYVNDMPTIFGKLAAAAGHPVETRMVAPGGWTLKDHWEKDKEKGARAALLDGKWDFVVLQEQSSLGTALYVDGEQRVDGDWVFQNFVQNWIEAAIAAGAKPVLYLTWAGKAHPEDQAALNYFYFTAAEEDHAVVAPVGLAWDEVRRDPSIELFQADGSHPTLAGSYLAACAIYAAIFGKNPAELPAQYDGVPKARTLQEAAWRAYGQSKEHTERQRPEFPAEGEKTTEKVEPEQVEMTAAQATGEWKGTLLLYPSGPVEMTLYLTPSPSGHGWMSHLELKSKSKDFKSEYVELIETQVGDGVEFTDPHSRSLEKSPVHYFAHLTAAGELRGTATSEVERKDLPPARFSGSFTLHLVKK